MMSDPRRLPTRKDAVANRERLLVGAETYFAERGIDAPLHGLADHVGVGIGTLYRNFPCHDDLVRALYDRVSDRFEALAKQCAQLTTGWDSLSTMLRLSVAELVDLPASAMVVRRQMLNDPQYRSIASWEAPLQSFLSAAQAEGSVRADVTVREIEAIPFSASSVQLFPLPERQTIAVRLVDLFLEGLRPATQRCDESGLAFIGDSPS